MNNERGWSGDIPFVVLDITQVANDIQIREIEIEFWAPRKHYSIKIRTLKQICNPEIVGYV